MPKKVQDIDHGFDDLVDKLEGLYSQETFSIGIFEDHPEQLVKAFKHEFRWDAQNIPARRWLSSFYDEHRDQLEAIYKEAIEEYLTSDKDKEVVFQEYSQEVIVLITNYLSGDPLSPPLSDDWLKKKQGPHQMKESGDMINAIAIRYDEDGASGNDADELVGADGGGGQSGPTSSAPGTSPDQKSGGFSRRNLGGRPKGIGFMRAAATIYASITGPSLYEGFGFRKRPAQKARYSTTRRYTPGGTRYPGRDLGRSDLSGPPGKGRFPSVSRVH